MNFMTLIYHLNKKRFRDNQALTLSARIPDEEKNLI